MLMTSGQTVASCMFPILFPLSTVRVRSAFRTLKMDYPNRSVFFYTQICLSIEISMGSHKFLYFELLLDIIYFVPTALPFAIGDLQ